MITSYEGFLERGGSRTKKLILALMAAALLMLSVLAPTAQAAVKDGRSIEAFYGRDLVLIRGYSENTDVRVDVLRGANDVVVGSTTQSTDETGELEINHGGAGDCWGDPVTPDIMPGDTVRTTVLDAQGNETGDVDSTTVRDVFVDFDKAVVGTDTITVEGHARSLDNAPIVPGSDALELRLNAAGFTWDANNGRKDLREDVAGSLNPDGSFTHVFNVSAADAGNAQASGFDQIMEWSLAPTDPGVEASSEITVFDEDEGVPPGCPARAQDALTQSSHPVVNLETVQQDMTLSGTSYGATGVKVSVPGGAQHDATLLPVDPAAPDGHQTWTAAIPASELAALPQGEFLASAAFEGAGVRTTPSTLSILKDTEAPANPTATPKAGSYNTQQAVTLNGEDGAAIHYTVNGTDPTKTSREFGAQIQVTASQTIKALAVDKAGNQSEVASFAYTIREATALELNSSRPDLTFGQATTLSGKLTSEGNALAGKPVILERRPAGASGYSPVPGQPADGLVTGADGSFRLTGVKPDKNTAYRARFVTQAEFKPSASPIERVNVKVRISNATPTTDLKLGGSRVISGQVSPAHTGSAKVTVKRGTTVVATKVVSLSDTSRYRLSFKPASTGNYSVSASFAKDADHLGNTSPVKSFKVIR
ncbi:MAG: chitobiase/beta-hexosaminidase C-terminal domain-containing protein [Rubrobacter sp.]|nr:chitobiase/beta-hexosaminidase C-terminal domain-containing protein [Rubrobacter sp.]